MIPVYSIVTTDGPYKRESRFILLGRLVPGGVMVGSLKNASYYEEGVWGGDRKVT